MISAFGWRKRQKMDSQAGIFLGNGWLAQAAVTGVNEAQPHLLACSVNTLLDEGGALLRKTARSHNLHHLPWNLSLEWQDYVIFPKEAPSVPHEETASAIRWQVRNQLEFPAEEALVDCFDIPSHGRATDQRKVYVVAAHHPVVAKRVDVIQSAGLSLRSIEVPELGLNNVARLLPNSEEGVALLFIPPPGMPTCLLISCESQLFLSRRLDFDMDKQSDFTSDTFAELANSIQRSLDYYRNNFRRPDVDCLYVAASTQFEKMIMPELSARLGVRIKRLPLETMLTMAKPVAQENLCQVLLALGAALRPVSELS